jgi:Holliday junction DNA helicase RuvA
MIGKLTGTLAGRTADGAALIDVGGVGYLVRVPLLALTSVLEGAHLSLFVHTAVREDAIDLYGFPTEDELSFFKLLTTVSSVGPKTAIGILNVADVSSLRRAIAQGDASTLTKVFGIGKKSAERIVVELRDKLADHMARSGTPVGSQGADGEVIEALMALGYRAEESRKILKDIGTEGSENVRDRLAAALRMLGKR